MRNDVYRVLKFIDHNDPRPHCGCAQVTSNTKLLDAQFTGDLAALAPCRRCGGKFHTIRLSPCCSESVPTEFCNGCGQEFCADCWKHHEEESNKYACAAAMQP